MNIPFSIVYQGEIREVLELLKDDRSTSKLIQYEHQMKARVILDFAMTGKALSPSSYFFLNSISICCKPKFSTVKVLKRDHEKHYD